MMTTAVGYGRSPHVLREDVEHHVRAVLDVEVARAESERRDGELANLERDGALQRAHERQPDRCARDRLVVARDDAVDEQLDAADRPRW